MTRKPNPYRGDDTLLFGIILGVLAFWLFAQTAPTSPGDGRRPRRAAKASRVTLSGRSCGCFDSLNFGCVITASVDSLGGFIILVGSRRIPDNGARQNSETPTPGFTSRGDDAWLSPRRYERNDGP